ncbi:hypothetical protein HDU86_008407 [Geranomyces michiganensis]|nr:hypothetical protein HDU86_008407 [Geranomyces michiganensis]
MSIFEMLVPESKGKGKGEADELHPCTVVAGTKRPNTDCANAEKSRRTSASSDAKDSEILSASEAKSVDSAIFDSNWLDSYTSSLLSESFGDESSRQTATPAFFEGPPSAPTGTVASVIIPTLSSTFAEDFGRTSSWLSPKPFNNNERLPASASCMADLPSISSAAAVGLSVSLAGPLTPALAASMPTLAYPTPTYTLGPAENSLHETAPLGQLLPPFYFEPSPVMIPPSICLPASECHPPADVQLPVLPTQDTVSRVPDGDFEVSFLNITVPRCPKPQNGHISPLATSEKSISITVPVPVLSHMPVLAVKKFVWKYLSASTSRAEDIEFGSTGNLELWHWEGARPRPLSDSQLIGQCGLKAEDCVIAFFPEPPVT